MARINFDFIDVAASRPVGFELNFEESSDTLHVHNDVQTLLNIKKRVEDANVLNGFLSRMQMPQVEVSDVPSGSRFAPWLSDKLDAAKNEFSSYQTALDDAERAKKQEEFDAQMKALKEKYGL